MCGLCSNTPRRRAGRFRSLSSRIRRSGCLRKGSRGVRVEIWLFIVVQVIGSGFEPNEPNMHSGVYFREFSSERCLLAFDNTLKVVTFLPLGPNRPGRDLAALALRARGNRTQLDTFIVSFPLTNFVAISFTICSYSGFIGYGMWCQASHAKSGAGGAWRGEGPIALSAYL